MKTLQLRDRLRRDKRSIPGEHDDVIVPGERVARHHQCMPGATLFSLYHKANTGRFDGSTHPLPLMSNDRVNILGGDNLRGRCDYVGQKRPATNFMQHFWELGL